MKNIILLIAALLMLSCGAKKTSTLKSESQSTTAGTITQQTNIVTAVDIQEETAGETCTDTYEPANPAEPMIIDDGKGNITTIHNGKKTSTKSKYSSKSNTQITTTATTAVAAAVKTETNAALQTAATDRKASFSGFYITLVGIIVFFICFFYLRKK